MDDLDNLLAGLDRADNIFANGLFLDRADKFLDHRQGNISLQQGHANFAQSRANIFFRKRAASGQPIKYAAKAVCQCVEHRFISSKNTQSETLKWGAGHISANQKCPAERNVAERGASSASRFQIETCALFRCARNLSWLKSTDRTINQSAPANSLSRLASMRATASSRRSPTSA